MPRPLTLSVDPGPRLTWPGGSTPCVLGRGGIVRSKREGDGGTPAGAWPLRRVLYRPDRLETPDCALPLSPLGPADGWCDEPSHSDYNRPVRLPFAGSHEEMWREDGLYDIVVVLGHNDDPVIPGAGSAIFLHVADPSGRPTAGCVAVPLEALRVIIAEAGPGSTLVVPAPTGGVSGL